MAGKTTLDGRSLKHINAKVPFELQDELKELYARGYRATEIIKEGIRACSTREGIMNRMKTMAQVSTTISGSEG